MVGSFFPSFHIITPELSETQCESNQSYADVFDLANAFLSIEAMTNHKLQKLCYYAKAWYLALNNTNIIREPFEAWVQGAIQPKLHQAYRCYGFHPIPMYEGREEDLPGEFLSFARDVFDSYGDLTGFQMEKLNHREPPWQNARKGLQPWQHSTNIISEDDMRTYYRSLLPNEQKGT